MWGRHLVLLPALPCHRGPGEMIPVRRMGGIEMAGDQMVTSHLYDRRRPGCDVMTSRPGTHK